MAVNLRRAICSRPTTMHIGRKNIRIWTGIGACLGKTSLWKVWMKHSLRVGNIYKIGTALVQVTQPREPCYKLGIRFGNQGILKEFIEHGHPGTYVRVLEKGQVTKGDELQLVETAKTPLTVQQLYRLIVARDKDKVHLQWAVENEAIPLGKREKLKKYA